MSVIDTGERLKTLREQRSQTLVEMVSITDKAKAEKRDLTNEELEQHSALSRRAVALRNELDAADSAIEDERRAAGQHFEQQRGNGAVPTSGEQWVDKEGRAVPVIGPEQRVAPYFGGGQSGGADVDFTFRDFVRGVVLGPSSAAEERAMSSVSDTAGGYLLTPMLSAEMIDRTRAHTVCIKAGARTVPMLTKDLVIARLAGDPRTSWHVQNQDIPMDTDPSLEAVYLRAKTLTALVRCSRELVEDASNLDTALRNAFAGAMGVEVDRAALFGTGASGQPAGLIRDNEVLVHSMGEDGASITSYDPMLEAWLKMMEANAADPTGAVMAPRSRIAFEKLKDSNQNPLQRPPMLQNLPFFHTTSVPTDETHGAANNASRIILGNWPDMLIGVRQELRIEVLRERFAEKFQYGFLAHLRVDVALAKSESFCQITGVKP